ncbi:hypothetical protein [Pseudoalteromonas sp. Of11M-6]|uniref:hypothetical protein n=1 Tax=Pseudoalteromonas sp. Of11M-6 TaxID=2917754 RepID=UPI001EF45214|nr:hypothetical protein [Pseudoalteromonas sp. Of11M-6]MCG7552070.1 hypothetical protein [Pseudoalteromonas sp. Of11M-6]
MANLPSWIYGDDAKKLAKATEEFWNELNSQLLWWNTIQHSTEDSEKILDLLAWERSVSRLSGEPLSMYAKRVQLAHVNAVDAGSAAGLERIFRRLGILAEVNERVSGFDWDQVQVSMLEKNFAGRERMILELIASYGKTCRRYVLNAMTAITTAEVCGLVLYNKEVVG